MMNGAARAQAHCGKLHHWSPYERVQTMRRAGGPGLKLQLGVSIDSNRRDV